MIYPTAAQVANIPEVSNGITPPGFDYPTQCVPRDDYMILYPTVPPRPGEEQRFDVDGMHCYVRIGNVAMTAATARWTGGPGNTAEGAIALARTGIAHLLRVQEQTAR
jgi:hypothetical protein